MAVSTSKSTINNGPNGLISLEVISQLLPQRIRNIIKFMPRTLFDGIEEIRIRQGKPLVIGFSTGSLFIDPEGMPTKEHWRAYKITNDDMERLIQIISNSSIYAFEDEIRNGFITLPGGCRAGIAGKAVLEGGKVKTIKHISSCNIRLSREVIGASKPILDHVIDYKNFSVYHTAIISPPRCGKTTILRDLIRQISDGMGSSFPGVTVGLVDERSEIAGCYKGVPQLDIGLKTDVLDSCPKAEGMMMLLRSMSPQVIATDEVGRSEDVTAIEEVLNAGVKVMITAHGSSPGELAERPVLGKLIKSRVIERYVILGRSRGVGTIEDIIDGKSFRTLGVKKC